MILLKEIEKNNKSFEEIMADLEDQTGNSYEKVDEYFTFIGALELYECVE